MLTHRLLISVFILAVFALIILRVYVNANPSSNAASTSLRSQDFIKFQRNYLIVVYLAYLGDWLQGPYLYSLYASYGFSHSQIGITFAAGFCSSLVFGTMIGSLADKLGRKRMCQVFGITYSAACFFQLFDSYSIVFFARILGGISTSLLFSVFETWMVCEHASRAFHPDLLQETFARATFGTGIIGLISGLIGQVAVSILGVQGPFIVAMFPLLLVTVLSSLWSENYGSQYTSIQTQFKNALETIKGNPNNLSKNSLDNPPNNPNISHTFPSWSSPDNPLMNIYIHSYDNPDKPNGSLVISDGITICGE